MNQTKTLVIGGVVVLIIVAGVVFYSMGNQSYTSPTSTTTPVAVNNSGNVNPQNTAGAPVVTTNSVVATTDTTVVVTGKVTPNGAFTNYWYEYGTTSNLGNKAATQMVGSGFIQISAPGYITGLTKKTTYYFRLVAENQYGQVAGAQYSFVTTEGNPPPVGSVPKTITLSASGITRTTADLNGNITPNRAATQYWFEWGLSANLGNTTGLVTIGSGTGVVAASQSLSNLAPDTTYYYRVNAQNQFGTVNGSILNFKTSGPAAASAPTTKTGTATSINISTATLRGTVSSNGESTSYWFEYSTDSLLGALLLKNTVHQTLASGIVSSSVSADISGLTSKTNYYFRLVAQNSLGTTRGDRETFKTK